MTTTRDMTNTSNLLPLTLINGQTDLPIGPAGEAQIWAMQDERNEIGYIYVNAAGEVVFPQDDGAVRCYIAGYDEDGYGIDGFDIDGLGFRPQRARHRVRRRIDVMQIDRSGKPKRRVNRNINAATAAVGPITPGIEIYGLSKGFGIAGMQVHDWLYEWRSRRRRSKAETLAT